MRRWLGRVRGPVCLAACLALCLSLGACAAALQLATREPPRLYSLTPKSTFADDLPEVDARISVEVPTATAGLNTSRIALRPTPTTLEYYADARWIDVVPIMVQSLLLESFDNAASLDVLGRGVIGVRADYGLIIHIREFQAEYQHGTPPDVLVRLQARLVRMPRRTSIASTSAAFTVTAQSGALSEIVAAFDEALGKALRHVVEWTIREVAKAEAQQASSG